MNCSCEFKTEKKDAKYCSKKCEGKTKKKRIEVNCAYCGKEKEVIPSLFKRLKSHYCDQKCRSEHLKIIQSGENHHNYNKVIVSCSGCNKEITIQSYRLKKHKYQFCSYECYKINIGKYYKGENNNSYKPEKVIKCDGCGLEFKRKDGEINKEGNSFCSHVCYIENFCRKKEKNEVEVVCRECNKSVKRYERLIKQRNHIFCSPKCKYNYYSKLFVGENHPNWNPSISNEERIKNRAYDEYHKWRISVFERDNYTCMKCFDDRGGNLVAHHLYNYSEYEELRTDINNGITLCDKCHKKFHDTYGYTNNNKEQISEFIKDTSL